jgi:chromosome segregation ATPase
MIYEQFNRHEEIMRKGELALRDREEEFKLLNIQVRDFARRIELMQRKIPQLRSYDEEIKSLRKQLTREQGAVDNVARRLESPDKKERIRQYVGRDFTLKELEMKVARYEQRINDKEQQLWEKQILLKELEDKIGSLSTESVRDTEAAHETLKKGGEMRAEAMTSHRKRLAALSEMAIYQVQKEDLLKQKEGVLRAMEEGRGRTAQGLPFDDRAARMLRLHEYDMVRAERARTAPVEDEDDDGVVRAGRIKFDAYPTADGLSRPYGAFPVFQPAPPPGYIRHYRPEGPRAIEI